MIHNIAGCTVEFPHAPYGTQLLFMERVIKTLECRGNALLEAPTGSGKTLSLLCSTLSWQNKLQHQESAQAQDHTSGTERKPEYCCTSNGTAGDDVSKCNSKGSLVEGHEIASPTACKPSASKPPTTSIIDLSDSSDDSDSDEVVCTTPLRDKAKTASKKNASKETTSKEINLERDDDISDHEQHGQPLSMKSRSPRIFYATRTHSQIAQVVRELKRTKYKPTMAVLASRDHYCIHKTVNGSANRDEECEKLVTGAEGETCKYFKGMGNFHALQNTQVHDIEDLITAGEEYTGCPYYLARKFAETAQLIFCPYSYLLDPVVRAAMSIDLSGSVLIFDEAHNIEDICREAASLELELDLLEAARDKCERCHLAGGRSDLYLPLKQTLQNVINWLQHCAEHDLKSAGYERYEKYWKGKEMAAPLQSGGLGPGEAAVLRELCRKIREEEKGKEGATTRGKKEKEPPKVGGLVLNTVSRLVTVLELIYQDDTSIFDYIMCVQKWIKRSQLPRGRRRPSSDDNRKVVVQFCLWCMNPALIFQTVARQSRSIILTSGTLTPMESFASELGTEFATQWSAPHVVDLKRQVWAGVLYGARNNYISATYTHTESHAFQDAVGKAVSDICSVTPDGVLMFFPSYSLLEKLKTRWELTGLWQALNDIKPVRCEPRGTGDHFDAVMDSYYSGVRSGKGGLLLAVCRGKVSEGLDFTDGFARAVLLLGIPYPYVKDPKVQLKKAYNDQRLRGPNRSRFITGDAWYCQQAFRALNQAIGRCIRHRHDFGAIILIDQRFCEPRNQQHLSRWFVAGLQKPVDFDGCKESLKVFFTELEANPPGGRPPPSVGQLHTDIRMTNRRKRGAEDHSEETGGQPVRQYPRDGPSFAAGERAFLDTTISLVAGENHVPKSRLGELVGKDSQWQPDASSPAQKPTSELQHVRQNAEAEAPLHAHDQQKTNHLPRFGAPQGEDMDISGTALHAKAGQDLPASPLHPLHKESSGEGNQHQDTLERHQTSGAVNHVDPACSPGNLSRPSNLRNWISGDVSMHMSYLGSSPLVMVHGIPAEQHEPGAVLGVLNCFDLVIETIHAKGNLNSALAQWQCQIPQGLQRVLKLHGPTDHRSIPPHLLDEVEKMRSAYLSQLRSMYPSLLLG
eukprot:jgi/Botrbrau1/22686/Bobra.0132s0029.2